LAPLEEEAAEDVDGEAAAPLVPEAGVVAVEEAAEPVVLADLLAEPDAEPDAEADAEPDALDAGAVLDAVKVTPTLRHKS